MQPVIFQIDSYSVRLYGNDLRGNLKRWANAVIYFYSKNKLVGTAYFPQEGSAVTADSSFYNGRVYFHATREQYERMIDLLRNEKPVFLRWDYLFDTGELNDGNASLSTSKEPVGEEES